ncbi:major facilitator superfamily transporter [Mollisia scopiformis]|uniref:Major facilitator superfamily transporter n=1 Tax=Mollisia scopiformis TaxID=149040 RepID=A0A132BEM3_MOLSC|nr:major facilitator superfamily transporter [Mollisia scopiformis]KUJ10459.1 major facilitator superfamily transporter [Mollisia scopiformis]
MANINLKDIEASKETVAASSEGSVGPAVSHYGQEATHRLLRKLDWRLLPFLCLIYMLCFLDRTNIGNARLDNMEVDLHMGGLDYNVALSIFFPFYVMSEIPSNLMLKRASPRYWFLLIMVTWGIIMTCQGLVKNYAGLLACRVFLGLSEGGLFPGVTFYITMWYPRHETGLRMAIFFSAATVAGAFGGFLARAIALLDGKGGLGAWSWIFIIEGLLTFLVALFCPLAISDYPDKAKFLTEEERVEVKRRLTADTSFSDDFDWRYVKQALTDWKIYANMVLTIGLFTAVYSISLFLPTILKNLGYSSNKSQLMTVPVYMVAFVCTIIGSYVADKSRQRGVFLLGFEVCAIVGFIMLAASSKPNVQYAGTFFAAAGIYPNVPLIGAWNSNNLAGSTKRAVGIGMQVAFGNLGGAISGFIYLSKDEPRFIRGHSILIALISTSLVMTLFMTWWFRRENCRRSRLMMLGNFTPEMLKAQEEELGDKSVTFLYTV